MREERPRNIPPKSVTRKKGRHEGVDGGHRLIPFVHENFFLGVKNRTAMDYGFKLRWAKQIVRSMCLITTFEIYLSPSSQIICLLAPQSFKASHYIIEAQ
jgi:hypothetical protein